MNDPAYQRIHELSWRRTLTTAEAAELQRLLAAHPEVTAEWETEAALNQALERLPKAPPVSSNFTALVLQGVEHETHVRTRTDTRPLFWRWLPRFAVAGLVVVLGFAVWHQHETRVHEKLARAAMARDVAQLGAALVGSAPELTESFEPILRLSDSAPKTDTDLLALMQ